MLSSSLFTCANVLYSLLVLVILLVVKALYAYVIKPYRDVQFYKSQGAISIFHWDLIPIFKNMKNASKHRDFFHVYKEEIKKNPNAKFIAENFGPDPHLIILDLDMVKELLMKHEVFEKDLSLLEIGLEVAKGTYILGNQQHWKKGRKIISSAFNFEFLKRMIPEIQEISQTTFKDWIERKSFNMPDLTDSMGVIAGEISGRLFFGKKFTGQKIRGKAMTTMMHKLTVDTVLEKLTLPAMIFGGKVIKLNLIERHRELNANMKAYKEKCREMIEDAEKNPTQDINYINTLLEARKLDPENERPTIDDLGGEFSGIFQSATDTTSQMVASALYLLWKHPHVLEKVKKEIDREFPESGEVTIETLNRMEYLTCVLKETLRIGGPTADVFTRYAVKDDELCGIKVKKGTLLNVYHNIFHTMDKYYTRPTEFIPERWTADPEFSQDRHKMEPYAYLPFSAGPRNCIGQHLAMISGRIIVSMFLKTFTYSVPEGYKFILVNRLKYETEDPIPVTLKPIKN